MRGCTHAHACDFTKNLLINQILKFSQKIDIIYIEKEKENCEMENKYELYDFVVSTVMTNVLVERERCGKFLLYDFKPELDMDKLYFNVAAIAADMSKEKLYLHMPFWDFIRFRMKFWRKRTNLRWFSPWAEKKLEDENLKLRIENAYLKELRRLRLEEEALLKKQRESSTASEENSN